VVRQLFFRAKRKKSLNGSKQAEPGGKTGQEVFMLEWGEYLEGEEGFESALIEMEE
jgi:hypothetical protein